MARWRPRLCGPGTIGARNHLFPHRIGTGRGSFGEYEEQRFRNGNSIEYWEGAPFYANPINAANRVTWRTYITNEKDWSSYWNSGPGLQGNIQQRDGPDLGRAFTSTFFYPQSIYDISTEVHSGMLAAQASWFDRRLVVGAGYRGDRIKFRDPASKEDAQRRVVVDELRPEAGRGAL